jgi:hypothetical protein
VQPGHTQEAIVNDTRERRGGRSLRSGSCSTSFLVLAIGQFTHRLVEHLAWLVTAGPEPKASRWSPSRPPHRSTRRRQATQVTS